MLPVRKPINSDLTPISGCVCVNCGSGPEKGLKRLSTYSRSFACFACFLKHTDCGSCHHPKHAVKSGVRSPCYCGCTQYRHGLEQEFDRQFDVHVGKPLRDAYCRGLGGKACGSMVLVKSDGSLPLLCARHEKEWKQAVEEGNQERDRAMNAVNN